MHLSMVSGRDARGPHSGAVQLAHKELAASAEETDVSKFTPDRGRFGRHPHDRPARLVTKTPDQLTHGERYLFGWTDPRGVYDRPMAPSTTPAAIHTEDG